MSKQDSNMVKLEELIEQFNVMVVEPGDFPPDFRESKQSWVVGRQYVRRKLHTALDTFIDSME